MTINIEDKEFYELHLPHKFSSKLLNLAQRAVINRFLDVNCDAQTKSNMNRVYTTANMTSRRASRLCSYSD